MLEVRIDGSAALRGLAQQMRDRGERSLAREMSSALARASTPVQLSIREEADKVMPSSGGYRSLLSRSLKFRTARRLGAQSASFRLMTFADGTKQRRDIKALENGVLRHPVFGRSRRLKRGKRAGTIIANPWAVTSIRSGFHQRGTDGAAAEAEKAMLDVLDDFAARLTE